MLPKDIVRMLLCAFFAFDPPVGVKPPHVATRHGHVLFRRTGQADSVTLCKNARRARVAKDAQKHEPATARKFFTASFYFVAGILDTVLPAHYCCRIYSFFVAAARSRCPRTA